MSDPGWRIDADGHAVRIDAATVCDFCLAPGPSWEFPAAPMPVHGHPAISVSVDEWAACDECRRLIEQHSLGALVERIVEQQRARFPEGSRSAAGGAVRYPPLAIHRRELRDNLRRFMDARLGPARPYS